MLILFLKWLSATLLLKIPAVFFYTSTKMILSALTSLLMTLLLGPSFIKKLYELKIGQHIRKEECPLLGKLHAKKQDTPTMGGILILCSIVVSSLLWMDFTCAFTWVLFTTCLVLGAIGARDDYLKLKYKNAKGLRSKHKFLYQLLFSGAVALYLLYPSISVGFTPVIAKWGNMSFDKTSYFGLYFIPFLKSSLFHLSGFWLILSFFFMIFVITGSSNAVNLTDGLDGLASGLVLMTSMVFALLAFVMNHVEISRYLNVTYLEHGGEIAIFLCAIMGACMGFLWYNGHPAQVFMGDTGSLMLGGCLGVSSILLRREFLLALVGFLFVLEALSVILQVASFRLRKGKRIFLCAPLHHHFEYQGLPETKIVIRFWIVGLVLALIGLASIKFQ